MATDNYIEKDIFKLGKLLTLTLYMNKQSGNTSLILWYATPLWLKASKKFMAFMHPITLFSSIIYKGEVVKVTICNINITNMLETV